MSGEIIYSCRPERPNISDSEDSPDNRYLCRQICDCQEKRATTKNTSCDDESGWQAICYKRVLNWVKVRGYGLSIFASIDTFLASDTANTSTTLKRYCSPSTFLFSWHITAIISSEGATSSIRPLSDACHNPNSLRYLCSV